jgi:hypothetical protein
MRRGKKKRVAAWVLRWGEEKKRKETNDIKETRRVSFLQIIHTLQGRGHHYDRVSITWGLGACPSLFMLFTLFVNAGLLIRVVWFSCGPFTYSWAKCWWSIVSGSVASLFLWLCIYSSATLEQTSSPTEHRHSQSQRDMHQYTPNLPQDDGRHVELTTMAVTTPQMIQK